MVDDEQHDQQDGIRSPLLFERKILHLTRKRRLANRKLLLSLVFFLYVAFGVALILFALFSDKKETELSRPDYIVLGIAAIVSMTGAGVILLRMTKNDEKYYDEIEKLELGELDAADGNDELYWSIGRAKLEEYLNQNLTQSRSIFWYSTAVMAVGFLLIVGGCYQSFILGRGDSLAIVSGGAGIVINFIAASFLLIYRSVLSQAKGYVSILERINTVGMSFQLLNSMTEGKADELSLKEKTKADVASKLIELYSERTKQDADTSASN